jgi:hypothetical protein
MTSTSIHFHHKVSGYFDYWYVCIPVLHYRSAWCRSGLISDHRHSRERHQVYKVRIIVNSRLHSLLATSRDWTHKSVQFVPLLFLLYSEAHRLARLFDAPKLEINLNKSLPSFRRERSIPFLSALTCNPVVQLLLVLVLLCNHKM